MEGGDSIPTIIVTGRFQLVGTIFGFVAPIVVGWKDGRSVKR